MFIDIVYSVSFVFLGLFSAIQILARIDAVRPLYDLKEEMEFLLFDAPTLKGCTPKYTVVEIHKACADVCCVVSLIMTFVWHLYGICME